MIAELYQLTGVSLVPKFNDTYFFITEERNETKSKKQIKENEIVEKQIYSHLFGGKLENGESYKRCAIREFIEEYFGLSINIPNVRRLAIQIQNELINLEMEEYDTVPKNGKYHKFLTFDINSIRNSSVKNFFKELDIPIDEVKIKVNSIFKWTYGEELLNPSSLLSYYILYANSKKSNSEGNELSDF